MLKKLKIWTLEVFRCLKIEIVVFSNRFFIDQRKLLEMYRILDLYSYPAE